MNWPIYPQFVIVIGAAVSNAFKTQAVASAELAKVISTLNGADVQANNGKYLELPNDPTKLIKFNANVVLANVDAAKVAPSPVILAPELTWLTESPKSLNMAPENL